MLPSQRDHVRRYRTRSDPFADVWQAELVPMLQRMPSLRATTLLEELQRLYPGLDQFVNQGGGGDEADR